MSAFGHLDIWLIDTFALQSSPRSLLQPRGKRKWEESRTAVPVLGAISTFVRNSTPSERVRCLLIDHLFSSKCTAKQKALSRRQAPHSTGYTRSGRGLDPAQPEEATSARWVLRPPAPGTGGWGLDGGTKIILPSGSQTSAQVYHSSFRI